MAKVLTKAERAPVEVSPGIWQKRVITRVPKSGWEICHRVEVDISALTEWQKAGLIITAAVVKFQAQLRNMDRAEFYAYDETVTRFDPVAEKATGTFKVNKAVKGLIEAEIDPEVIDAEDADKLIAKLQAIKAAKAKKE